MPGAGASDATEESAGEELLSLPSHPAGSSFEYLEDGIYGASAESDNYRVPTQLKLCEQHHDEYSSGSFADRQCCNHGHGNHPVHHAGDHSHSRCGSLDECVGWRQYLPHSHGLSSRLAADKRTLSWAFLILLCTCVGQFIAGLSASSSVLAAEAIHTALDGLTVVLSLVAVIMADRPSNIRMSYGYARAETLSALLSIAALGLLCIKLFGGAVERLWYILREQSSPLHVSGKLVFIAEGITLIANVVMAAILSRGHISSEMSYRPPTGHSGAPDGDLVDIHEDPEGHKDSLNIRALRAHIIADSVENTVVLFAGAIMWAVPRAAIIDPILTMIIVFIIGYLNRFIVAETLDIVFQAAPSSLDMTELLSTLSGLPHTLRLSSFHVWTLTSGLQIGTVCLETEPITDVAEIDRLRQEAKRTFAQFGVGDATVEIVCVDGQRKEDRDQN